MQLRCPECELKFSADSADTIHPTIYCPSCGSTIPDVPSEAIQAYAHAYVQPPNPLAVYPKIYQFEDGVSLEWPWIWSNPQRLGWMLLGFLVIGGIGLSGSLPLLLWIIGLVCLYGVVLTSVNKTRVHITSAEIKILNGPLPNFSSKPVVLRRKDVIRVYKKQMSLQDSTVFDLVAVQLDGREKTLLYGIKRSVALSLEATLAGELGV